MTHVLHICLPELSDTQCKHTGVSAVGVGGGGRRGERNHNLHPVLRDSGLGRRKLSPRVFRTSGHTDFHFIFQDVLV